MKKMLFINLLIIMLFSCRSAVESTPTPVQEPIVVKEINFNQLQVQVMETKNKYSSNDLFDAGF